MARGADKKYDEKQILLEIYRMRGLTITQLCDVFFESKHYAYKYLKDLKESGYLLDSYQKTATERVGKMYSCTDKAIDMLMNEGLIERAVAAKDNKPTPSRKRMVALVNELYRFMTPYGIKVVDSREFKRKHALDRNSMPKAGIQMLDDREYAVYMFFRHDQLRGSQTRITDSMYYRFIRELEKAKVPTNIILAPSHQEYEEFQNRLLNNNVAMGQLELQLIPFGINDFGFKTIILNRNKAERIHDLESILNARLKDETKSKTQPGYNFMDYVMEQDGKEIYVMDYLNFNLPKLNFAKKLYAQKRYESDGRELHIVCWNMIAPIVQNYFGTTGDAYKHIKVIPVSNLNEMFDTLEMRKLNAAHQSE